MTWKKLAFDDDLTTHTGSIANPHSVTKTQVGLGNCDNTSDLNKPVSTATSTAISTAISGISGFLKLDGSLSMTGDLNFNKNNAVNMALDVLSTAPATPVVGQIYFSSVSNAIYINVA